MRNTTIAWHQNPYLSQTYRVTPDRFGHLPERSLLSIFGYSTGAGAPNTISRLRILNDFLYTDLPRQWPGREAWHAPGSRARLHHMVSHIEWAAEMMERNAGSRDCSDAVSQRRADARGLLRL